MDFINDLKKIAAEATPGRWSFTGNYPFYVNMKKPAPSLSKHDDTRPTYWRYQDGLFVSTFSPSMVLALLSTLEGAIKTLNKISGNTYGTEICNTDEENNEILARLFFHHQDIAREALAEINKLTFI